MGDSSTYKGLEVIGAGFGRTGTLTLKTALEILGFKPCYHMQDVLINREMGFWMKLFKGEKVRFSDVFEKKKCMASCDNPMCNYWKEQLEQYPNAKVVLTVRNPEKWYESWNESLNTMISGSPRTSFFLNVGTFVLGIRTFHFALKDAIFGAGWEKEEFIRRFNEHNKAVIAECPKNKLLVYEVSQGWEPLCTFLGKPVPDVPFPHLNDRLEMARVRFVIEFIGGLATGLVVGLVFEGLRRALGCKDSCRGGGGGVVVKK